MNGSLFQPLQHSRNRIPASRAIRSSFAGHAYRKGNGDALESPIDDFKVMGCKGLRRNVVLVEAPSALAHAEGADVLPGYEPLQVWNAGLDNEAAAPARGALLRYGSRRPEPPESSG